MPHIQISEVPSSVDVAERGDSRAVVVGFETLIPEMGFD
jgi:hypothetical protein